VSILLFIFYYLKLNRFTINSINHNHDGTGRIALDDETNEPATYWLRSAGTSAGTRVAGVQHNGPRSALNTDNPNIGFRPLLSCF